MMVAANIMEGKSLGYMESVPIWPYCSPNDEELPADRPGIGGGAASTTFSDALYQEATQNCDIYIVAPTSRRPAAC